MAHGRRPGLAAFGCDRAEADLFHELAPRSGVAPATTDEDASVASAAFAAGHRCASVGHRAEVSAETLRALRLAGVEHLSTRSIGFDHIDLGAARDLGITVQNVVYGPDGVADYTVMLILMALRDAVAVVGAARRQDFRLRPARGRELRDLTVGVVGVGHIGGAVVRRLQAFGCRLLAWGGGRAAWPAERVDLDDLLARSDVVTLHLPLDARTRHLIGREQIASMRPGALLVNTSRGALVDTAALVEALEGGHLGGAALDVLEGEEGIFYLDRTTAPVEHRFLSRLQRRPDVVVTPHTAYYTERALHDTVEATLRDCLRFERGRANDETEGRDLVRGLL